MKRLLLIIFSLIALGGYSQSTLQAMPDTFTVLQAQVDTFAVTANDSIPLADSVCITFLDTVHFSVLNCTSIIYHPDSTFTGRDTCRYVLCDTALACDTTLIIFFVNADSILLPSVSFKEDSSICLFGFCGQLFTCGSGVGTPSCVSHRLINTSSNFDSVVWKIRYEDVGSCSSPPIVYTTDTIIMSPSFNGCVGTYIKVCLTAYNNFGSVTICDTSCQVFPCMGISEVPLTHISIYPTPVSQTLIIDMSQNTDDISTHYTTIDLYNSLGQKVRTISNQNNKIIRIPVTTLPDGIYLATISDATGTARTLGRFTIAK